MSSAAASLRLAASAAALDARQRSMAEMLLAAVPMSMYAGAYSAYSVLFGNSSGTDLKVRNGAPLQPQHEHSSWRSRWSAPN